MSFNPYTDLNSYFNFHQRLVILNLLQTAKSQKTKTISGEEVYQNYIEMCEKYNIEKVFEHNIIRALKSFEVAGYIKIRPGLKITKLNLGKYTIDDWIEAILQDPEFEIIKAGEYGN